MRGRYQTLKREEQAAIAACRLDQDNEQRIVTGLGLPYTLRGFLVALNFRVMQDHLDRSRQHGEALAEVIGRLNEARVNR